MLRPFLFLRARWRLSRQKECAQQMQKTTHVHMFIPTHSMHTTQKLSTLYPMLVHVVHVVHAVHCRLHRSVPVTFSLVNVCLHKKDKICAKTLVLWPYILLMSIL